MATNTEAEQSSLDALILSATSPLVKHEDPNAVQQVVQAVSRNSSAASAAAVRILAHKIHSPQEMEAMKALSVLQACIINCGPSFHCEIGKFRFLNEMIKLVSPKYAGNHTTSAIKSRVLELLFCWRTDLTHEPKIAEAYNMLKKQGVIKCDPVYIGPLTVCPAPRPVVSSIEDSERSQLLQRLLQSKKPEDLDRANALIQAMVRDDQKKMERNTHTAMELEMARNNIKVLDEMLTEHEQRSCGGGHVALMGELLHTCTTLRNTLYHTVSQCTDTDTDMGELISVNEELSCVIGRYKLVVDEKRGSPASAMDGYAPLSTREVKANGVAEERYGTTHTSAGEDTGVGDMLLDLSMPREDKPAVSAATTDLINQELHMLGLSDEGCGQSLPAVPDTAATAPLLNDLSSNSATLLEELGGAAFSPAPASAVGGGALQHPAATLDGLVTPMMPQPNPVAPPIIHTVSDPASNKLPFNSLNELDLLSKSLLRSALPANTYSAGQYFKQPEKLSINQLKLKQTVCADDRPHHTALLAAATVNSDGVTNTNNNQRNSHIDSLLQCDSLSSSTSNDSSASKVTLHNDSSSCASLKPSYDVKSADIVQSCSLLAESLLPSSATDNRLIDGSSLTHSAQFVDVKPLSEIKVAIENIQPGDRAPLTLLSSGTVSTSLHYTLNSPRADVSVFVLTTTSRSPAPLTQYVMQAVVPKSCKARLLPPSATALPQYSPFLPPPAVTQIMIIANPNEVNVSLKLMLSYCINDDPVTEMAELDNLSL